MGIKLLFADDSVTMQKVMQLTIDNEDINLVLASNGEEALAMVAAERPDIVVADISMPELDGFELCRAIKKNPDTNSIPVVLISGELEKYDSEYGTAVGADGHITKPFKSKEFISSIINFSQGLTVESVSPEDGEAVDPTRIELRPLASEADVDEEQMLILSKISESADPEDDEVEIVEESISFDSILDGDPVDEEEEELLSDSLESEAEVISRFSDEVFVEEGGVEEPEVFVEQEQPSAELGNNPLDSVPSDHIEEIGEPDSVELESSEYDIDVNGGDLQQEKTLDVDSEPLNIPDVLHHGVGIDSEPVSLEDLEEKETTDPLGKDPFAGRLSDTFGSSQNNDVSPYGSRLDVDSSPLKGDIEEPAPSPADTDSFVESVAKVELIDRTDEEDLWSKPDEELVEKRDEMREDLWSKPDEDLIEERNELRKAGAQADDDPLEEKSLMDRLNSASEEEGLQQPSSSDGADDIDALWMALQEGDLEDVSGEVSGGLPEPEKSRTQIDSEPVIVRESQKLADSFKKSIESSVSKYIQDSDDDNFSKTISLSVEKSIREVIEKQVVESVKEEIGKIVGQQFQVALPEVSGLVDKIANHITPHMAEKMVKSAIEKLKNEE